jgi:hypothetical protein
MNLISRRRLISSIPPLWSATSAFVGGSIASLTVSPSVADEPYAGDPQVIADWMQKWMGGPRSTTGLLRLARFADPIYVLTEPIEWHPSNPQDQKYQSVTVPKYFVTDLASVPRVFWSWLRPDGLYAYAAVIHDYLYWTQAQSRENANEILKIVMEEFAVPKMETYAIYGAVALFGKSAWEKDAELRKAGERRILKELPTSSTVRWEEYKKLPGVFEPQ